MHSPKTLMGPLQVIDSNGGGEMRIQDPKFIVKAKQQLFIDERQSIINEIASKALEKRRLVINVQFTEEVIAKLEKGEPVVANWEDCALLYPEEIEEYIEGLLCAKH